MGRKDLKRGLKNFQAKLQSWLRSEDQNDTLGSQAPTSQKQTLATTQFNDASIKELWNIAYENLRGEDGPLIEEYEKKLQGNMIAGLGTMLSANIRDRMQTILEHKMEDVNANTWRLKFMSSEIEVRDIVQPILGVVSLVNEYVTDAISVSSYASLAWAGVSLLLPLFINPPTQMASLANGLELISTLIAQSRMREELYIRRYGLKTYEDQIFQQSHHEYKSGLERLYRQILKFQAKAYCYFTDSSASRFCLDVVKQDDWDQLIGEIHSQETMFSKLSETWRDIQYDNECLAAEKRHQETMNLWFTIGANVSGLERAIQEAQNEKSRIDLFEWLCSIDHTELYNSARNVHANGTGDWLIHRRETFKTWEKTIALKSFLWLHGNAGSGKSILSSSVIKHLQDQHMSNATNVLAYFYFSFSDSRKQTVDGMLSSLIRQISARRPMLPQAVQSLGEYKIRGGRPDTETLIEALIASIQGFSTAYIVIDALDECPMINDERRQLLNTLGHVLKESPNSLHMFCTSRKEVDIDKAIRPLLLEAWGEEIDLSDQKEFLNEDVAQYIDSVLAGADYNTWPDYVKDESRKVLMEKSDGMFQYIRCQFENLQKLSSPRAVRKALQGLPSGLDSTYNRMLQSIDRAFQPQVIASLKWLACSIEPLEIGILAEIFVLPSTPDDGFENVSPLFSPFDVLKYFPGLIAVEKSRDLELLTKHKGPTGRMKGRRRRIKGLTNHKEKGLTDHKETHYVRLAHFSIKEYLTSDRFSKSDDSSFAFTDSDAHLHVGRLCLAFHLHISSMTELPDFIQHDIDYKESLITYASRNWAEHLEMIPHTSWPLEVPRNAILALSTYSRSLLIMVSDYSNHLYSTEYWVGRPHCYTALRGFCQLTEMLISKGAGVCKYLTQGDLDEGLCHAVENRRKNIAKLFLDKGARMHDCLERAARKGDAAVVKLLLDHGTETNAFTDRLDSALRVALWSGHLDVLKLLLDRGADVNSPFKKQDMTKDFLSTSRQSHIVDCLRFLFSNGAGIDMKTDSSLTVALYETLYFGLEEASRLLLGRGAKLTEVVGQKGFPLQAAVTQIHPNNVNIGFVRHLLELGADPNAQGGTSNTALQAACSSGYFRNVYSEKTERRIEVIKLLIHKGADISIKGGKYGTALQAACANHNVPIFAVKLLLEKGADVNCQGGEYGNALQAACETTFDQDRNLEVVQLLLSRGADVRAQGGYYGTALQAACASRWKNITMVRLLINTGADVNARGGRYGTALQAACAHGHTEVVRLLLEEGALVNAEGGLYGTALQAACDGGHLEVARLLLKHGAKIHLRDNGAWHAAAQSDNDDLVRLLLDLGVDVNDQHGPRGTALHAVLHQNWMDKVSRWYYDVDGQKVMSDFPSWADRLRLLISRGADPNLVAGEYGTALQTACTVKLGLSRNSKYADPSAVPSEFLLESCPNIDINVQSGLFGSALQAAAYSGQTSTIGLLLNKGANVNAHGGKYGSALNAAVIARNWDIVQILLDAGAVPDCHTMPEPDEEWLQRVLEDKDDGQGAVERYRKFWEVEMASLDEKGKEKA